MSLPARLRRCLHDDFDVTAEQGEEVPQPLLSNIRAATAYVNPITILSTLPSAGVDALLALMLCGIDLTVIALIGIILADRYRQEKRHHDD
jgi:hypothetical protein